MKCIWTEFSIWRQFSCVIFVESYRECSEKKTRRLTISIVAHKITSKHTDCSHFLLAEMNAIF